MKRRTVAFLQRHWLGRKALDTARWFPAHPVISVALGLTLAFAGYALRIEGFVDAQREDQRQIQVLFKQDERARCERGNDLRAVIAPILDSLITEGTASPSFQISIPPEADATLVGVLEEVNRFLRGDGQESSGLDVLIDARAQLTFQDCDADPPVNIGPELPGEYRRDL